MDVHSKKVRSKNMRAIKGKNTQPERLIRSSLHKKGFRFRISPLNIEGKPDIWLPKWNAAIFVNGCFWHAHQCTMFRWPKTRTHFWKKKLSNNRKRDKKQYSNLIQQGIRVLVIWECSIRGKEKIGIDMTSTLVSTWLFSHSIYAEISAEGLQVHE